MKRLIPLILSVLILLLCCREDFFYECTLTNKNRTCAKVVSYSLLDNLSFFIRFNQIVEIKEYVIDGKKYDGFPFCEEFIIPIDKGLKKGEKKTLSLTASTPEGNLTRASFSLTGKNENVPQLLLNEISVKGTSSSPDRIEIVILSDGNLAGVRVSDGYNGSYKHQYTFPDMDVRRYDIVVLYWDKKTTERTEKGDFGSVYYINALSPSTLAGPSGVILLEKDSEGEILDAFMYADLSNEENFEKNEKIQNLQKVLDEKEAWFSLPVDSALVTSSRVFARRPGFQDNNSSDDWFITKARTSTFGAFNVYSPYEND